MSDERLIGSAEAAQMLGIDRSTLSHWVNEGKIAVAQKLPGRTGAVLFRYSVVAELRARRRSADAAQPAAS